MANGIPGPVGAFLRGRQIEAGLQGQALEQEELRGQIAARQRLQQQTQSREQERQRILGNVLNPQADRFGGQVPSVAGADVFGTVPVPEAAQLSPEIERELLQANIAGILTDSQLKATRELALRQGEDPNAVIKRLNIEGVQDASRALVLDAAGRTRLANERIQRIIDRNGDPTQTEFIRDLPFDQQTRAFEATIARLGAGPEAVGKAVIATGAERQKQEGRVGLEQEEQEGRLELERLKQEGQIALEAAKQAGIERPITFEQKESIKVNIKRLSTLSDTKVNRQSDIKIASKFLRGFRGEKLDKEGNIVKGPKFVSGATRAALKISPGVFTAQAQFDEELDAFAEKAARALLKAVGEVRPTDADVKGAKKALFGIGKDEKTNLSLLTEFLNVQNGIENEFQDLRQSKKDGTLKDFVPAPSGAREVLLNKISKALAESRAQEARGATGRGIGEAPALRGPPSSFINSSGLSVTIRRAQ